MITYCYYKNREGEVCLITVDELSKLNKDDFLWVTDNLFNEEKCENKMVYVVRKNNRFFRNWPDSSGNFSHISRGEAESLTHKVHVDAIGGLKEFSIKFYDEEIKLFVRSVDFGKIVKCNNKTYIVDLAFNLEKTEPEEYYNYFNGVIYFEVYHTCPIDSTQAEDFNVENLFLYEYKILKKYNVPNYTKSADIIIRKASIRKTLSQNVLRGYPVCTPRELSKVKWRINDEKHNYYTVVNNKCFTIYQDKKKTHYCYSIRKYGEETKFFDEYNKSVITELEKAKRIIEYIIFKEEYQDRD